MRAPKTEVARLFAEWEAAREAKGKGSRIRLREAEKALLDARAHTPLDVFMKLIPAGDWDITDPARHADLLRLGMIAAAAAGCIYRDLGRKIA